MENILWISGEDVTPETVGSIARATNWELADMFDYLYRYDPRRPDEGKKGDEYSQEMAAVQNEIERRYFASFGLPEEVVKVITSAGNDWGDDGYLPMLESLRRTI